MNRREISKWVTLAFPESSNSLKTWLRLLWVHLFIAPEVVKGLSYDSKADVWSMGCTFYEILTLTPPFTALSLSDLIGKVKRGQYMKLESSVE